ncbi:hemicentin-1-like isoform X2 [Orbicella faveolata]|uniref:hemicentin-1-like isoform X2 n=1 Tax=Orbicella faveolata TaxID=48498 RepID=UPI0009E2E5E4|nr:hemicentin-1-like isoform X2 [Orbicella faveolata]
MYLYLPMLFNCLFVFSVVRPVIELLGPSEPLHEGDSANLTCKIIKGLPEPQLSIFKNGDLLLDEKTTLTLLLANVTERDEARYTCKARNAGGNFTDSIYLTVKTPPVLYPGLMNRSVELNSTFTMTCIESGDRPLQINWTKNGVDLGNRNNNTYTVDHVTFDHAGLYGCTAVNWAGKTHTMFWIDVTVSPQICVSPSNKSVPEGYPGNFSCKATVVPEPKLSWKFNDGDLPSGVNQTSLGKGSFLELLHTTKHMEGIYKCTAENKANATTSSAYLHVFEKPSAEVSPRPYPKLTAGDELRLTCKVNRATVAIAWKKNDDEVIPRAQIDTGVDGRLSKLFIEGVVEGDSGEYSCEARNRPGIVARSTVKINVMGSIAKLALEWYYIVGTVFGCIVIFAAGYSICKRRRAGKNDH